MRSADVKLGAVLKGHALSMIRTRVHTTIGPRTQRWYAKCRCGWVGPFQWTRIEARQDFAAHKEQVSR